MNDGQPQPNAEMTPDEASSPDVDALRREAEEQRDRYLRAVAELDNFRKRSAREIDTARKFGAERLALSILPVRDSLEAGISAAEQAGESALVEGQRATLRLLDEAFAASGIREIAPYNEPFDPNKHEALSLVSAPDAAPNTVVDVVQKGYELNDRLLRAAKVLVSRASEGP
jgi:molecular chaperone GrpE